MNDNQLTYQKNMLSKWLITLTLIFSLFSFSGAPGYSPVHLQKPLTERVISRYGNTKQTRIAYKQQIARPVLAAAAFPDYLLINSAYGHLVKVQLDHLSFQFASFKSTFQFHHPKTVPPASEEHTASFLLG